MARSIVILLLTLASFLSFSALAQDEFDDVLGGFDELDDSNEQSIAPAEPTFSMADEKAASTLGSVVVGSSVNLHSHKSTAGTDYDDVSRLKTQVNFQHDRPLLAGWDARVSGYIFYDWIYRGFGSRGYTDQVMDDYEKEAEFKEVWVRGKIGDRVDVKIGRQVVNWGRSESLRVLDQLNPLDNREPGIADIENLRLPVFMAKTDYYVNQWSISLIAIPEMRFSKNPPYGSDFYTAPIDVNEKQPDDFSDTSWAMAATGIFSGWDISFHAARIWADYPYLQPLQPNSLNFVDNELQHSRINLLGSGANYSQGSWMFRGELAFQQNMDFTVSHSVDLTALGSGIQEVPVDATEKNRIDALLGVEYYGYSNTVLSLDVVNRHIASYGDETLLYTQKNMLETALRYDGRFIHETLEVTALAVVYGSHGQNGKMYRLSVDYELRQSINLGAGLLLYNRGDIPPFDGIKDNDRLFLEFKRSF